MERSPAQCRSSCRGPRAGMDLAEVAGMITRKGLVTLDDILRIVREDYPDMTAEELQKRLDALVEDGHRSFDHCPPLATSATPAMIATSARLKIPVRNEPSPTFMKSTTLP